MTDETDETRNGPDPRTDPIGFLNAILRDDPRDLSLGIGFVAEAHGPATLAAAADGSNDFAIERAQAMLAAFDLRLVIDWIDADDARRETDHAA